MEGMERSMVDTSGAVKLSDLKVVTLELKGGRERVWRYAVVWSPVLPSNAGKEEGERCRRRWRMYKSRVIRSSSVTGIPSLVSSERRSSAEEPELKVESLRVGG